MSRKRFQHAALSSTDSNNLMLHPLQAATTILSDKNGEDDHNPMMLLHPMPVEVEEEFSHHSYHNQDGVETKMDLL